MAESGRWGGNEKEGVGSNAGSEETSTEEYRGENQKVNKKERKDIRRRNERAGLWRLSQHALAAAALLLATFLSRGESRSIP